MTKWRNLKLRKSIKNDFAATGSSAITAAEQRALEAELARNEGKQVMMVLWDLKKFFDSINIEVLFKEAVALNFPFKQLILSMLVHQAPRMLKLGSAVGEPITNMGRSMLAGCKRSTQFARVYTLRLVRSLAYNHAGNVLSRTVSLYQHVDDLSALVVADNKRAVVNAALDFTADFKAKTDLLQLEISDKSTVVPDNDETKKFARIAQQRNVPMKTASSGVDIGVDTAAASRRAVKKQSQRINATAKRARRTAIIARMRHKARRIAITGVRPALSYCHTAVGMAPTAVNQCKSKLAEATGIGGAGTCATSILRWCFRKGKYTRRSADPRVNMPLQQVQAWIKLWRGNTAHNRKRLGKTWPKTYRNLANAPNPWARVNGPAAATIVTLLDLNWKPISPCCWICPAGKLHNLMEDEGLSQHEVVHKIRDQLNNELWSQAALSWNGTGLELGPPSFVPADAAHRFLLKKGKQPNASALEQIICNKSWCGERLVEAGIVQSGSAAAQCIRCGEANETRQHRYYDCPANKKIDDDDVRDTQHFASQARDCPEHQCMWYRAILPRKVLNDPVGYIDTEHCYANEINDFTIALRETGEVGTDGSLEDNVEPTNKTAGAGAAVYIPDRNQYAMLYSRVPGEQTVPRAEITALLHTLNRIDTCRRYTIYIDAKYVIDGVKCKSLKQQKKYLDNDNGDLWLQVYRRMKTVGEYVDCVKVKSHVKSMEQYESNEMTITKLLHNEGADAAADHAVKEMSKGHDARAYDSAQHLKVQAIARRLAAIEVDVWNKSDSEGPRIIVPSDRAEQIEKRVTAIKRKHQHAVDSTSGGDHHDPVLVGRFWKCKHCSCYTSANPKRCDRSKAYWTSRPCTRARKVHRSSVKPLDDFLEQYHRYILHNPIQHFDIASPEDLEVTITKPPEEPQDLQACQECGIDNADGYVQECLECYILKCVNCQGSNNARDALEFVAITVTKNIGYDATLRAFAKKGKTLTKKASGS